MSKTPTPPLHHRQSIDHKKTPTTLFLSLPDPLREKAKPYKPSDVLPSIESDYAEIHSNILNGRADICTKANMPICINISIPQWTKLFEDSLKGKEPFDRRMRMFALRLAKTSPEVFGDLWEHASLGARDDTRAWKAAYNLFVQ